MSVPKSIHGMDLLYGPKPKKTVTKGPLPLPLEEKGEHNG